MNSRYLSLLKLQVMAPSPNASINTPGQANNAVQSPLNATDEQQYREKYRQLTKYIEPMKRMIARIEKDGKDSSKSFPFLLFTNINRIYLSSRKAFENEQTA